MTAKFLPSLHGVLLAVSLLFAGKAVAAERAAVSFPKSGKWVANYDVDACHLIAQFGSGDNAIIARFTRYQPGDEFDLSIIGKPVQLAGNETPVRIGFGLAPQSEGVTGILGTSGKQPLLILNSTRLDGWRAVKEDDRPPAGVTPEQETRVTALTLDLTSRRRLTLGLGSMGKPMAALRTCMDNLLKHWGYEPEVQARLTRWATPVNSPQSWLNSMDYPTKALREGHNGLIQFRLEVDETGKVLGCHILARTSPDDFADATCRGVTRRARLLPALDAKGSPVRSYYIQKVRWMIPG